MGAGILDIVIEQGATFERVIRVTDPLNGLVNISDVTSARGQIRKAFPSGDSFAFTIAVTSAASGLLSWTMDAATSASIPVNTEQDWRYDIELVRGLRVERILQGIATISPEVTR